LPCFALSQATNCLIVNSSGRTASEPATAEGVGVAATAVDEATGVSTGAAEDEAAGVSTAARLEEAMGVSMAVAVDEAAEVSIAATEDEATAEETT
jgi:hypothetical protein